MLGLRERGIRDLAVLRAMEAVPRAGFVAPAHAALANRNIALPIAEGQSCPAPLDAARVLAAADLRPGMRVLEVGTGSGWMTALLMRLGAAVVSIERRDALARAADRRIADCDGEATIHCQDVFAIPAASSFDRIVVDGSLDEVPDQLWRSLSTDGAIVHGDREGVLRRSWVDQDGARQKAALGFIRMRPLERTLATGPGDAPSGASSSVSIAWFAA